MKKEIFRTLTEYEHSRIRTEMYLGSRTLHTQTLLGFNGESYDLYEHTWVPALWTGMREIIDNALDELIGYKYGDTIEITYDPTAMYIEVVDNGRGIPVHEISDLGKGPAASILMGEIRAGRNFDEREQVGGANGLGGSIVNFTSEWFELEIDRDGTQDKNGTAHFEQRWDESEKGGKYHHKTKGPHVIRGSKKRSGTMIRYRPSAKVFPKMVLPLEFVRQRIWDIAVANPGVKVHFNGVHLKPAPNRDTVAATYFPDRNVGVCDIVDGTFRSRFYLIPDPQGRAGEHFHGLVNNIPAFDGGSHIDAFRTLFYSTLVGELNNVHKKEKLTFRKEDIIGAGLMVFNITTMHGPNFANQAKTKLISETVDHVKKGFLESDVKSFIRRNPEWFRLIADRVRNRTDKKNERDLDREQRKIMRTKVARLADATSANREKCILFLMEGESAEGLFPDVRDPAIHGYLSLRGKIANVNGMTPRKVLENVVLVEIMSATGLKIGTRADRDTIRFGKIYIASDEDEDGKNITALLVNFFYTFWPELFSGTPVIHRFNTPFITLEKGKERRYVYSDDYYDFQTNIQKYSGWKMNRAKGLSALTADDWKHAVESPKLTPFVDDGELKETLDMIFNEKRTEDRKKWLERDQ